MKKVNFRVRNFEKEQFLTYNIDDEATLDEEVLDFLEDEEPKGIVPVIYDEEEECDTFSYDITEKICLSELSKQEINAEMVLKVMRGLVLSLIDMGEYRVPLSYLVLNRNYIYINSDYEVEFICIPLEEMQEEVDLNVFLRNFVASLRFESSENGDYVARMLTYINNTAIFNLRNMVTLIEDLMDVCGVEIPEDASADIYVDYQEIEEDEEIAEEAAVEEFIEEDVVSEEEADVEESIEEDVVSEEEADVEESIEEDVVSEEDTDVEESIEEDVVGEEEADVEESIEEDVVSEEEADVEESIEEDVVGEEEADVEESIEEDVVSEEEADVEESIEEDVVSEEEADVEESIAEDVVSEEEATVEESITEEAAATEELVEELAVEAEVDSVESAEDIPTPVVEDAVDKEELEAEKPEEVSQEVEDKVIEEVKKVQKKPTLKTKETPTTTVVIEDELDEFLAEMEKKDLKVKRGESGLKIKKDIKVNRASIVKSNQEELKEAELREAELKAAELKEAELKAAELKEAELKAVGESVETPVEEKDEPAQNQAAPKKVADIPKVNPYLIRVNTEERIMITKQNFKVGKASMGVDYTIKGNGAVSRVHAIITNKDDIYYIKDNKSTNHTIVNGKILEEGELEALLDDCNIVLGDEEFIFKLG